jgi:putative acetyltransferase
MAPEGLVIRPFHPDDAADVYEIVSHPAVARMLLQLPSMELSETLAWAERQQPGRHRLVAEAGGKVIGSGSLTQAQNPRLAHSGRLGMMVHPDYWGQGIGSQLLAGLLDVADKWLSLQRVELEVFTENTAAIHLYRNFGFATEGTRRKVAFGDGRWLDDLLMARLRGEVAEAAVSTLPMQRPSQLASRPAAPVNVRPVHPDDVDQLYDLFRHPAVARTTLQLPSQELARTAERVKARQPGFYRLVAVAGDQILGSISLYQPQNPRLVHSAGLGMMVHPDFWGQGIGSRLMEAILDLADNWLNLKRVELEVNVDNPAAIRLYEKFGFAVEGTKRLHTYGDGRWADSYFMARIRE